DRPRPGPPCRTAGAGRTRERHLPRRGDHGPVRACGRRRAGGPVPAPRPSGPPRPPARPGDPRCREPVSRPPAQRRLRRGRMSSGVISRPDRAQGMEDCGHPSRTSEGLSMDTFLGLGIVGVVAVVLVALLIIALIVFFVVRGWIKVARADEALVISGKSQKN